MELAFGLLDLVKVARFLELAQYVLFIAIIDARYYNFICFPAVFQNKPMLILLESESCIV
jgi:hypothetical protein